MTRYFLTALVVLLCLCSAVSTSYACNPIPIARICGCPKFYPLAAFDSTKLTFEGTCSYDPDNGYPQGWGNGITEYQWDIWCPPGKDAYQVTYDPPDKKEKMYCKFTHTGKYKVRLRVKDDDGEGTWSHGPDPETWTTCYVYIFTMHLDIHGVPDSEEEDPGGFLHYNHDDDNNNSTPDKDDSGTVTGEDDLRAIFLGYEPPELAETGTYMELKIPYSDNDIRVWTHSDKGSMVLPSGSDYFIRWSVGNQPSPLWVEAYQMGRAELWLLFTPDNQYPWYPGGLDNHDPVKFTVLDVDLLVNNTSSNTDDYVLKEKPSGARTTPINIPAGATDNHIPMKVSLKGPSGFSCKVKLSDSGGGDVTIKKTGGSAYPAEGETVTVGTDVEVHIFGTQPSTDLDDVTITATTDKTGDTICGEEDLTVIWVYDSDMYFRGSDHDGDPQTDCTEAKFTNIYYWMHNKVGKFIYKHGDSDVAYYQEELKAKMSPYEVISDVEWDMKREVSGVYWGPGPDPRSPTYKGETGWENDDHAEGLDQDVIQNSNCKDIFSIDCPGGFDLPYTSGFKYSQKAKFREWVEVEIGGKWYVCSPYEEWRMIMHVKFQDATAGWVEDSSKTNEIVPGTISGWAGSWSED